MEIYDTEVVGTQHSISTCWGNQDKRKWCGGKIWRTSFHVNGGSRWRRSVWLKVAEEPFRLKKSAKLRERETCSSAEANVFSRPTRNASDSEDKIGSLGRGC
uniref:Uncharacterized protein n=1 Tax=Oryzias melastigma TaxID=30732 RepID=A0A3B3CGB8_ORYME